MALHLRRYHLKSNTLLQTVVLHYLHQYNMLLYNLLNRKQIFYELRENGLGVNVHYIPIHTQPYYLQFGFKEGDFPNSENYYKNSISLPLFYSMTFEQQEKVFNTLMKVLQ